jgi:hypothetical protein
MDSLLPLKDGSGSAVFGEAIVGKVYYFIHEGSRTKESIYSIAVEDLMCKADYNLYFFTLEDLKKLFDLEACMLAFRNKLTAATTLWTRMNAVNMACKNIKYTNGVSEDQNIKTTQKLTNDQTSQLVSKLHDIREIMVRRQVRHIRQRKEPYKTVSPGFWKFIRDNERFKVECLSDFS